MVTQTEEEINLLWPLSENYEYSAELGLGLRLHLPGIWDEWGEEERYPLPQAAGYAFLQYLEQGYPDELRSLLPQMIREASGALQNELRAAALVANRSYSAQDTQEMREKPATWLWHPELQGRTPWGDRLHSWTVSALGPGEASGAAGAEDYALTKAHEPSYLQGLWKQAEAGGALLTPETILLPDDEMRLRASAGLAIQGIDRAFSDGIVLLECRPGSHHAGRHTAGGTCLVNNLAIAAAAALRRRDVQRVAVLDIDAHHGNGTEAIFRSRDDVYTISLHQAGPWFPGTGDKNYRGEGRGYGYNLNLECTGRQEWLRGWQKARNAIFHYRPDLLLLELSADAHWADPASDLGLEGEDFYLVGQELRSLEVPTIAELGSSLSPLAWSEALQEFIAGWRSIKI